MFSKFLEVYREEKRLSSCLPFFPQSLVAFSQVGLFPETLHWCKCTLAFADKDRNILSFFKKQSENQTACQEARASSRES